MTDVNSCCGSGRVGKEIEIRNPKPDLSVANISIAQTRGYGERKTTQWTVLQVWGKQADFLAKYAHKGDTLVWSGATYVVEEFKSKEGRDMRKHYFEVGKNGQVNLFSKQDKPAEDSRQQEQPREREPIETQDDPF